MHFTAPRKRSNMVQARNKAKMLVTLNEAPKKDYRALAVAMSSAPLDGMIGDAIVARQQMERELGLKDEKPDGGRNATYFDDLL